MITFNPNKKYYYCKKDCARHYNIKLTPKYTIDIKYGGLSQSYNKKLEHNNNQLSIDADKNKDTYEVSLYKGKTKLCLNEHSYTEGFVSIERINDFMKVVQNKSEIAILQYFRFLKPHASQDDWIDEM